MFRVYIQLSAGMRPGTKADEVKDIVEGLPFNVRSLTLDIIGLPHRGLPRQIG